MTNDPDATPEDIAISMDDLRRVGTKFTTSVTVLGPKGAIAQFRRTEGSDGLVVDYDPRAPLNELRKVMHAAWIVIRGEGPPLDEWDERLEQSGGRTFASWTYTLMRSDGPTE